MYTKESSQQTVKAWSHWQKGWIEYELRIIFINFIWISGICFYNIPNNVHIRKIRIKEIFIMYWGCIANTNRILNRYSRDGQVKWQQYSMLLVHYWAVITNELRIQTEHSLCTVYVLHLYCICIVDIERLSSATEILGSSESGKIMYVQIFT